MINNLNKNLLWSLAIVILFVAVGGFLIVRENKESENISAVEQNDGRYMGFIRSMDHETGELNSLTIDFADWNTNCTDCPNGFEIINSDPKVRKFIIADDADITMATYSHAPDGNFNYGESITQPTFYDLINGKITPPSYSDGDTPPNPYTNFYVKNDFGEGIPFWITLKGGVIHKIQEQYVP